MVQSFDVSDFRTRYLKRDLKTNDRPEMLDQCMLPATNVVCFFLAATAVAVVSLQTRSARAAI